MKIGDIKKGTVRVFPPWEVLQDGELPGRGVRVQKPTIRALKDGRVLIETNRDGETSLDVFVELNKTKGGSRTLLCSFRDKRKNKLDTPTVCNTNMDHAILDGCAVLYKHASDEFKTSIDWYRYPSEGRGPDGLGPRRRTEKTTNSKASAEGDGEGSLATPVPAASSKTKGRRSTAEQQRLRDTRDNFLKEWFLPFVRRLDPLFDVYYQQKTLECHKVIDASNMVIKAMLRKLEDKEDKEEEEEKEEEEGGDAFDKNGQPSHPPANPPVQPDTSNVRSGTGVVKSIEGGNSYEDDDGNATPSRPSMKRKRGTAKEAAVIKPEKPQTPAKGGGEGRYVLPENSRDILVHAWGEETVAKLEAGPNVKHTIHR